MKVIVTGGAGFIGSHIVDKLVEEGHDITIIDNESADNDVFYWHPETTHLKADITEYEEIVDAFEGVDVVFHLAAESRLQPAILNPRRACTVNYIGTFNVLQAAREHNVGRVIYSSTSSAYGLMNEPPLSEDMTPDCLNPYASTKVAAEDLCRMYTKLYGVNTITFRYLNVYGDRLPDRGQYAPVIGIFFRQVNNGETMTIVGDGEQRRDFVHVEDVAKANLLAMHTDNESCFGEVYNVGSGVAHSVLEVSEMIGDDHKFIDDRPGEAKNNLANIEKIKRDMKWKPTHNLENWIKGAMSHV